MLSVSLTPQFQQGQAVFLVYVQCVGIGLGGLQGRHKVGQRIQCFLLAFRFGRCILSSLFIGFPLRILDNFR